MFVLLWEVVSKHHFLAVIMRVKRTVGTLIAACAILAVSHVSASRDLLQNSCLSQANNAVSGPCQQFVSSSSFPPSNATDAQLQDFISKNGGPTQSCCVEAGELVTQGCQCDRTVQQFSTLYNLTPEQLVTFARAAKLSCGTKYIASDVSPYCASPSAGRR